MFEEKKIGEWNALIHFDETENMYSIFWEGKGWIVYRIKWREINSILGKEYIKNEIEKFIEFYNSKN